MADDKRVAAAWCVESTDDPAKANCCWTAASVNLTTDTVFPFTEVLPLFVRKPPTALDAELGNWQDPPPGNVNGDVFVPILLNYVPVAPGEELLVYSHPTEDEEEKKAPPKAVSSITIDHALKRRATQIADMTKRQRQANPKA